MEKNLTRSNVVTSLQVGYMETPTSVPFKQNFGFCIKNEGDEAVQLEVNLVAMPEGEYITTKFDPGWNAEIVREIHSGDVSNIKIGF